MPSERKPLGWTGISVVGPMGRTIADTRLQLAATAGPYSGDPLSYPIPAGAFTGTRVDLASLRIGYTEDFGVCETDAQSPPEVVAGFGSRAGAWPGKGASVLSKLPLGCRVLVADGPKNLTWIYSASKDQLGRLAWSRAEYVVTH